MSYGWTLISAEALVLPVSWASMCADHRSRWLARRSLQKVILIRHVLLLAFIFPAVTSMQYLVSQSGQKIKPFPSPPANSFNPLQFLDLRLDVDPSKRLPDHIKRSRMSCAATSNNYLVFDNGQQACPGQFLTATKLRLMLT